MVHKLAKFITLTHTHRPHHTFLPPPPYHLHFDGKGNSDIPPHNDMHTHFSHSRESDCSYHPIRTSTHTLTHTTHKTRITFSPSHDTPSRIQSHICNNANTAKSESSLNDLINVCVHKPVSWAGIWLYGSSFYVKMCSCFWALSPELI